MADYTKDPNLIATHLGDDYDRFLNSIIPPVFMKRVNLSRFLSRFHGL